jgi:transposase
LFSVLKSILSFLKQENMMEYTSKDLDHLGIVAAMCEEIELAKTIDALIPTDPRSSLSLGEAIQLMIINGLGFTSRPLYLEAQFFSSKPISRLIGRTLESDAISDDKLGRVLDRCYEEGCDRLFAHIASKAALLSEVDQRFRHLDTTSISVHGSYDQDDQIGLIQYGYSKDHTPDLKQYVVSLMSSQDGDVPLLAQTVAGNTSDKVHFRDVLLQLKQEIKEEQAPFYAVMDSAFYTEQNLQSTSSHLKWISRVPETLQEAKRQLGRWSRSDMETAGPGYFFKELQRSYGGVEQRWILVFSEQAYERESKTLRRQVDKEQKTLEKELKRLKSLTFDCEQDALKALERLKKSFKYHQAQLQEMRVQNTKQGRGRASKASEMKKIFQLRATCVEDQEKVRQALEMKGTFILATNEQRSKQLSAQEIIFHYKSQQSVERGFRFLKDPCFLTSSIFLKKESRIIALSMIMCLSLLVYTLAQRRLRRQLKQKAESIPSQTGKPTERPTLKWVFQMFEGVHLLFHQTAEGIKEVVLNMTCIRYKILQMLGPRYEKMYASSL